MQRRRSPSTDCHALGHALPLSTVEHCVFMCTKSADVTVRGVLMKAGGGMIVGYGTDTGIVLKTLNR